MWRCDAKRYAYVIDAEIDLWGTTAPRLEMTWWPVKHWTPKGVRLQTGQFINFNWTKQWASRTQEEALQEFIRRKRLHISFCEGRLAAAQAELALALPTTTLGELDALISD